MSTPIDFFEKHGYVTFNNAMPEDECRKLTEYMFKLHQNGSLVKDDQCPVSDAVYGDPVMESLLENMSTSIGNNVGRKLLPTYAYARIYRPGEILKKHTDRPSCEISATITLGFDAKTIWPIYMDAENESMVELDVGDMVVYKGCEVVHWRKPFKGNWHVQVFLHYVDANGPYADYEKDGRHTTSAGLDKPVLKDEAKNIENPQKNQIKVRSPIYGGVIISNNDDYLPGYFGFNSGHMPELMLTNEECQRIIDLTNVFYSSPASVGVGTESKVDRAIRDAEIFLLENDDENRWVFDKVIKAITLANNMYYDYDIAGITHGLQLIKYQHTDGESRGHYDWHIDAGNGPVSTRKISATIQLSNPDDYQDCDLIVNNHGGILHASRERGAINMFPSYMPHQVTKITGGIRYALVIWVHGSKRFR
jgi:hypothetical protein